MAGPWEKYGGVGGVAEAAPAGPWSKYAAPEAVSSGSGEFGFRPYAEDTSTPAVASSAPAVNAAGNATPSFGAQVGRGFALGARNVAEGTVGPLYDLAGAGMRMAGVPVRSFAENMDALGLPKAETTGEKVSSALIQGAGAALTPGAAVRGLEAAGTLAAPAAARAVGALGDFTASNAALGASAGLASDTAQQMVPEPYKPIAGLAGGLVGVGAPLAVAQGVRGTVRAGTNALAPFIERAKPVLNEAGQPILSEVTGAPLIYKESSLRRGGEDIASKTSDVGAVRNALADIAEPAIPGDKPTLFQATRDPALGMNERQVAATGGNEVQAAFRARADAQKNAQLAEVGRVGEGGDTQAVREAAQADVAGQDAAMAARQAAAEQAAQQEAQTRAAGLQEAQAKARQSVTEAGADLPPDAAADVGAGLRRPAADSLADVKRQASELYKIDPEGKLALDVGPLKDQAAAVMGELPKSAKPLEGEEAAVFQLAGEFPQVQSFRELGALRERVGAALRSARRDPAQAASVRRLSMLQGGIDDSLEQATREPVAAGAATGGQADASAARAPATSGQAAPQVGNTAYTPTGQPIQVRYGLHEADDLIASHDADMRPNPAFPAELQPRQRERLASQLQVDGIAKNLQPERLGPSSTVADGAPIIGPDGIVEAGNGRVMALRQAYKDGGPQAQAYRDYLTAQGYDTAGFKNPVLARTRETSIPDAERPQFTRNTNASSTLAISASEQAAGDATRLSADMLDSYKGGALTAPENADFLRSFTKNIVDPNGQNAFADKAGALSQDGLKRVQTALVHKAYNDQGLSAALAESTDPTAKVLAGAMQDAAGPMAQLKSEIQAGRVDPGVDLAPALTEATQLIASARVRNISLRQALDQGDAFSKLSPQAEAVLKAAYGPEMSGRMSQSRMAAFLADYAKEARQQSTAGNLFGANETAEQIIQGVSTRYGKTATGGTAADASGNAARVGAGDAEFGGAGRGSGNGAAGQADAGGAGRASADAGTGSRAVLKKPALTPNFDAEARAKYRQANAFYKTEVIDKRRNAPGVGEMLKPGPTAGIFDRPDYALPEVIVKAGNAGSATAKAYLEAGGDAKALETAAAFSLRKAAVRDDGTLDVGRAQKWARDRESFLSAVPDVAAKVKNATKMQALVDEAAATQADGVRDAVEATIKERAAASKAMQGSIVGKIAGEGDTVSLVGRILNDKVDGLSNARALKAALGDDFRVRAGLERAVGQLIERDYVSRARGVASEGNPLAVDAVQKFLQQKDSILREMLGEDAMTRLQRVSDSLARARLSTDGTRVGVGSDTAQKSAGAARTFFGKFGGFLGDKLAAPSTGATIGYTLAGAPGGAVGAYAGAEVGKIIQAAREAGIRDVEQLRAEAHLNLPLARILYAKVNPQNEKALANALTSQLRRISLVSAQPRGERERRQSAVPIESLLR